MKKTLVSIDFDGTVSPIDQSRDFTESKDWNYYRLGFSCAIHDSVIELLQDLKAIEPEGNIVSVWGSTWHDSTEDFPRNSNGAIPEFPWLNVGANKAEVIIAKAVSEGFERVVIVEDSPAVIRKIKKLALTNTEVEIMTFKPKLELGLTEKMIAQIRDVLELP